MLTALGSGPRYMIRVTHFCTLRESKNLRPCENRTRLCDKNKIRYLGPLPTTSRCHDTAHTEPSSSGCHQGWRVGKIQLVLRQRGDFAFVLLNCVLLIVPSLKHVPMLSVAVSFETAEDRRRLHSELLGLSCRWQFDRSESQFLAHFTGSVSVV